MKRGFTLKNRFISAFYSSIITVVITLTIIICYSLPLSACEGVVQAGNNIVMKMLDPLTGETFAKITFNEVTNGGKVKMAGSSRDHKSPSSYKLLNKPAYYDITTDADYSRGVEICVNHKEIGFPNASSLRVSQLINDSWEKLKTTIDMEENIVCSTAPSLSNFAFFEDPIYRYGPILWFHSGF